METLSLPSHLRHLVAADAPEFVESVKLNAQIGGENCTFIAGIWPVGFDKWRGHFHLETFARPLRRLPDDLLCLGRASCLTLTEFQKYSRKQLCSQVSRELDEGAARRVVPAEKGVAHLSRFQFWWAHNEQTASFHAPEILTHDEIYSLSQRDLKHRIEARLGDENSELHFAYDWVQLDQAEQFELFTRCRTGSWREMAVLVDALMHVMGTYEGRSWHPELHWQYGVFEADDYFEDVAQSETAQAWEQLMNNWFEAMREHFVPYYLLRRPANPQCLRYFYSRDLRGKIENGTGHETLEALRTLNDWAQKHFPDRPELLDFPVH